MGDNLQNLAIVLVSVAFIVSIIHMIITDLVKKNSDMYKNLCSLNKQYNFKSKLLKRIEIFEKARNKREFDVVNTDDVLCSKLESKISEYDKLILQNEELYLKYREYIEKYRQLLPEYIGHKQKFAMKNLKLWIFNFYERYIYKIYKLQPYRYTKAFVKISYESPQGKKSYSKSHLYSYDGLKKNYDDVKKYIAKRTTRQYIMRVERAKVSAKLRAEVLKRDKYTCQMCNATRSDGVLLHVDHIIPISKGGKTTLDNLQTLCERCNLGKGDRYDETN